MSELEVIQKTSNPNTIESLTNDLKRLGLKTGDTVLVHSSLSSLGWVCGEEVAVIESLLQTVGEEGTICMPAHSGGNSDPSQWMFPPVPKEWCETIYRTMPPFQKELTPTRGIGRIAEQFRKYPNTLRSEHPQVSFCANGKYAEEITKEHALTPQFSMESPLGKLYQLNARVLLLGVGYDSCTCFHLGEYISKVPPLKKMGAAVIQNQKREWVWFEDYDYDNYDFEALGNGFEKQKEVVSGKVGNATSRLFSIAAAVDFATEWLKNNR